MVERNAVPFRPDGLGAPIGSYLEIALNKFSERMSDESKELKEEETKRARFISTELNSTDADFIKDTYNVRRVIRSLLTRLNFSLV